MILYLDVNPQALRQAMRDAHITYRELAHAAEMSYQYLHDITAGRRPYVHSRFALAIEDHLDVPRGSLFGISQDDASLLEPYLNGRCVCA